jgi:hypothetical protein
MKASQKPRGDDRPDLAPSKTPFRDLLREDAANKALKALRRHGEESFEFLKASRSCWLCNAPAAKFPEITQALLRRAHHAETIRKAILARAAG